MYNVRKKSPIDSGSFFTFHCLEHLQRGVLLLRRQGDPVFKDLLQLRRQFHKLALCEELGERDPEALADGLQRVQ